MSVNDHPKSSPISNEIYVYKDLKTWLGRFLSEHLPSIKFKAFDTHGTRLDHYVSRYGLDKYFNSMIWKLYSFRVDSTAFLEREGSNTAAFVWYKEKAVSLKDLAQLLGYARIARPFLAYLVSPSGASAALNALILTYGRTDVLEYDWPKGRTPRIIVVARWDAQTKSLDASSILPPSAAGTFGFPAGLKTL